MITLKAIDTTVTIHDTKEGLFAIRVADWLSEKYGTGRYLSSNNDETEAQVWGTATDWTRLVTNRCHIGSIISNSFNFCWFGDFIQASESKDLEFSCPCFRNIECQIE